MVRTAGGLPVTLIFCQTRLAVARSLAHLRARKNGRSGGSKVLVTNWGV